jgi:ferritin
MLNSNIVKKIEEFVYKQPRSIQEIAKYIGKSWRTADRYIKEIQKDFGTISTKVFRGGTRGALKIVYWASVEKASSSVFQEQLEKQILQAKRKEDFSAFDIFQHIEDKDKRAILEKAIDENSTNLKELAEILKTAKKQVLSFSGNLSFINLKNKNFDMFKILEDLVKKGVSIKVICRVDIAGKKNIKKLLSLNFKYGKEMIEIRHKEHPIRAFIIDNKIIRIKEIKEPTGKIHELDKKIFIFYTIKNKDWTEWLSRIFWNMFSSSVISEKRLKEMEKL